LTDSSAMLASPRRARTLAKDDGGGRRGAEGEGVHKPVRAPIGI